MTTIDIWKQCDGYFHVTWYPFCAECDLKAPTFFVSKYLIIDVHEWPTFAIAIHWFDMTYDGVMDMTTLQLDIYYNIMNHFMYIFVPGMH